MTEYSADTTSSTSHSGSLSGRRAAIYARVSTERQKEEATIESQIAEVRRVVEEAGDILQPDHIYMDDGYTGELLARPALDRMRDAARARAFDVVYVYDRGRLSRRFAHQELILEELADHDIAFVSLHDAPAATPEEQVLQAMQGVFHEYDRIRIIERFRRGKLHKVRSGRILGYIARFGYTYVPSTRDVDGHFVINEQEAPIVRQIFHWIGNEGQSLRQVVRQLHALGVPPRRSPRGVWNTSTLHAMVIDELYVGRHYYNKTEAILPRSTGRSRYRRIKKVCHRPRPREEWIELAVPAIIDQELFDRAQAQLQANRRFSPRNTKRLYLCQGLIYCPCGRRLTGTTYGRRLHPDRPVDRLMVYRCIDRECRFPQPALCRRPTIRADVIDPLVWRSVVELLTDRERLRGFVAVWHERQLAKAQTAEPGDSRIQEIKNAIQAAQQEEARYLRLYGTGDISTDVLGGLTAEVRTRRARLQVELKQTTDQAQLAPKHLGVDELVERAVEVLHSLDLADRKATLQFLVTRITAEKGSVTIEGTIPTGPGGSARLRSADGNATNTTVHCFNRDTPSSDGRNADVGIQFELVIDVPPPDNRRGYSAEFIVGLGGSDSFG